MYEMNDKNLSYDRNVRSPYIGELNHLHKNASNHIQANGKLEFEGWLVAIEQIAERLFEDCEVEEAVQYVLETHIIKLDQQISSSQYEQRTTGGQSLKALVDLLRDPEMVQFLGLVHKAVLIYYKHYADSKGLMNFERFVRLCKDFSIFPDILPKSRLKTFFYTLASIHSTAELNESQSSSLRCNAINHIVQGNADASLLKKSLSTSRIIGAESKAAGQSEIELIDEHLFVEALALCAFELPYNDPQPTDIEKVRRVLALTTAPLI